MNNLLQYILQDKTLLLICALILSVLSNLIYTVKENNTKRISKKTMETISFYFSVSSRRWFYGSRNYLFLRL